MFSSAIPDGETVLADLGTDVTNAVVDAVDQTRQDWNDYRTDHPDWVATGAKRTHAALIHDRLWYAFTSRVAGLPDVVVVDNETKQQIMIAGRYKVRMKRHQPDKSIASYPTAGAFDFWQKNAAPLPGLEIHPLAIGYMWDPDLMAIGDAVVSYRRDDIRSAVWAIYLKAQPGSLAGFTWTPVTPTLPTLDLSTIAGQHSQAV